MFLGKQSRERCLRPIISYNTSNEVTRMFTRLISITENFTRKNLTKPLCGTPVSTTSNRMPNANLLSRIFLLKPFKSIHIKFSINRLSLLPTSLLLQYGSPQFPYSIPLMSCKSCHIINGMLH